MRSRHFVTRRTGHAALIAEIRSLLAASYSNGELVVRSLADGGTLARRTLAMKLAGDTLKAAAQSPLLSDDDRANVGLGRRLDDRVNRIADEKAHAFALENLGDRCRYLHLYPPCALTGSPARG